MGKNEFGTLVIRLVLGVIFIIHGYAKVEEGVQTTAERFASYQLPYPELFTFGVIGLEIIGGAFLIIGFSIRFIAFLFVLLMIGAIVTVKFALGFLHGYEFDVALMAMATYLLFSGSRLLALDNLLIGSKNTKSKK